MLYLFNYILEGDAILENGNLPITVSFVLGRLTTGHRQDLVNELWYELLHGTTFNKLTCREIDPVLLPCSQIRISGNLHRGNERAERRAATCGEQARNEANDYREISIFKNGVTL